MNQKEIEKYDKCDKVFDLFYSYSLDYVQNINKVDLNRNNSKILYPDDYNQNTESLLHRKPILLQPCKSKYDINLHTNAINDTQNILNFLINQNIVFDNINNFFIPKKLKLLFETSSIYPDTTTPISMTNKENIERMFQKYMNDKKINNTMKILELDKNQLIELTYLYIIKQSCIFVETTQHILKGDDNSPFETHLRQLSLKFVDLNETRAFLEDRKYKDLFKYEISDIKKVFNSLNI